MTKRIPLNSESLQIHFPEVYQDFFSKSSLVVSAPRSVTWLGEHAVRYDGITMRQALPIRTYVGLTVTKKAKATVVDYTTYDPLLQQFRSGILEQEEKNKIEHQLVAFLDKVTGTKKSGFAVRILSELPLERAIGSIGSLITPLIVAALIDRGKITREEIQTWKSKPTKTLIEAHSSSFDFVFRTLWKWEGVLYPTSSGANPFVSLLPSTTPVVFASKKPVGNEIILRRIRNTDPTFDHDKLIDRSRYWGMRLSELTKNQSGLSFPFDWGIVTTSEAWGIRDTVSSVGELQNYTQKLGQDMERIGRKIFGNIETDDVPYFIQLCTPLRRKWLWQHMCGPLNILSFAAFLQFLKLAEGDSSSQDIEKICEVTNKLHSTFYTLNFITPTFDRVLHRFREVLTEKLDEDLIGLKMNSTSRRGNILFLGPAGIFRPWIDSTIDQLRKEIHEKIYLDYASWLDGVEVEGGVRVEQDTIKDFYASYLAQDAVVVTHLSSLGESTRMIKSRADLAKLKGDILIDGIHSKIMVAGRSVTSKELPSQKTTVDLLQHILAAPSRTISNRDLPESSYSIYRNEFQGKLTGPFIKLIKKRLGKECHLRVEGSLTDFSISFDPKGLNIFIIETL